MLECVRVHAIVAGVHHVVVRAWEAQRRVRASDDFERFVAAGGGDDGVGGCDGGDDVLDDALGHAVGDAGDVEFVSAVEGALVEPGDVFGVVGVECVVWSR